MKNVLGTGKIVGLVELPCEYLYDFYSFSRKIEGYSITIWKPSFLNVPSGGWSEAGKKLITTIFEKTNTSARSGIAQTIKTVRKFNALKAIARKVAEAYCVDISLLLVEGKGNSLTRPFTYTPIKVVRFFYGR